MKYEDIVKGKFISRKNRFVATVTLHEAPGKEIKVHVKNTGRCKELLVPGNTIYLEDFRKKMGTRKMLFDLISVDKNGLLVNMDSQVPNKVVEEALKNGSLILPGLAELETIKREYTYGDSRLDFYLEDKEGREALLEVKGATLEEDGHCQFPDAPTQRGIKHLLELEKSTKEGYKAYVLFLVQMEGMVDFRPNDKTHPEFGQALRSVSSNGKTGNFTKNNESKSGAKTQGMVDVLVYDCKVSPDEITLNKPVKLLL